MLASNNAGSFCPSHRIAVGVEVTGHVAMLPLSLRRVGMSAAEPRLTRLNGMAGLSVPYMDVGGPNM